MDEVIKFLKMWLLILVCFVLTWGLLFINHVDKAVSDIASSIQATTQQTNETLASLNGILLTMNRPCGAGQPCGTLADVAKTLATIRGTAGQLEIAAHHEDARLDALDAQETALYGDTHKLLQHGSTALETANATIAELQPVEVQLSLEARQLNVATANLNVLLTNPDIPAAIGNTNSALGHINATVADTQQAVHAWLHPTWPRKVWNGIQEFSVDVGRVLF